MAEHFITFAAGASYGLTTVVVGQPLDTVKVRMQALPSSAKMPSYKVAGDLVAREGIRGLYRGGLPLFLGGAFMRSAQFGVAGATKSWLEKHTSNGKPAERIVGGLFDWQVIVAGMAGGISRGLVEIPTDFFKTRRQVEHGRWTFREIKDGTGVTLMRNTALFSLFMVYVDLSKQLCNLGYVPSLLMDEKAQNLSPFAKGAICANLAWLSVWPFDVVKTQQQSGNYGSKTTAELLRDNFQRGRLFRGVLPGLFRSTIANGSSMVLYEYVQAKLTESLELDRKDIA